jgi:hypothetical protein
LAKNKLEGYKSTYGSSIWVLNYWYAISSVITN